jgi:MFS-type transporter involved in bile tolerance (Atg22 family)
VDKWTADYVTEEDKEKLARSQELLIEANCHQLIFAIFKQKLNDNLVLLNELLLLTIALLFGGNRVCQDALLQEMIRDKDNLMLSSIEDTIRYLGDELYRLTKIR